MNLNQLKIFYLASKLENLSHAAQELNITQPAVTKGIQRIQEHYDIKLVNRFGKKLVLTDAGKALYRVAEKIFELETQAEESIREFQQKKKGHIRIHASESFGAYYLPAILNTFSKDHPFLRVSVSILPTETVVENIAGLKTDIGFISYPLAHEKVICREILEDQMVFIAPPNSPLAHKKRLTVMDLASQSMIVHEKGSVPSQAIMRIVRENKISISIPLELSSNIAIIKAVVDGLGIALVCRKVAEEEIQSGRLVELPFPGWPLARKFYIVHHKDK
ncbi:MAG: LysR family transcriptional regulator, partial [Desulfobacterales bacterium]